MNTTPLSLRMPRQIASALLMALLVLLPLLAAHAAPSFPALTGRVVDDAGVLSDGAKAKLAQMLAGEEQKTTNQIVVVTLKSLQGYPIGDFGYQLGRAWGIGQKKKDNGALIIIAPNDHKARIEVGYGLEGDLTDAQTKIVIERYMLPAFRRGDYDSGVLAGTTAVLQILGGVPESPPSDTDDEQPSHSGGIPWGVIVFILIWLVFGRFLWPLLLLGGLSGRGGRWGGGFGGGGFGGGGFSGGGGSFGGGGASGSW